MELSQVIVLADPSAVNTATRMSPAAIVSGRTRECDVEFAADDPEFVSETVAKAPHAGSASRVRIAVVMYCI